MPDGAELALPPEQVEELVRTIVKGLRAFQMYLPNNPIYQRGEQAIKDAFLPIWSSTQRLTLSVVETDLVWEEQVVYHQPHKSESFAWMLYKDGMRLLSLHPGVEEEEMVTFLKVVTQARLLAADAADDLLTLLWEQNFQMIDYQFAEVVVDHMPVLDPQAVALEGYQDPNAMTALTQEVRNDAAERTTPAFDMEDFDSTLYFLEKQETDTLRVQVEDEYRRDVRTAAFAALLDTFELQPSTMIREEILGIFDSLFPNLLNRGEFRAVAALLREFRAIAQRVTVLDVPLRDRLLTFQARLSEPAILSQLLQSLEDSATAEEDEDVGEVLGELHAEGLETMLTFLPTLKRPGIRRILEASVDRLGAANSDVVLRLLEFDSEALPGTIALCGRLRLQVAVPWLDRLVAHQDAAVRLGAVEALSVIGSPGALTALERALDDVDRGVRHAALTTVVDKGYRAALRRLEAVVLGKGRHELERAEKRQFFEAFAVLAGPAAVPILTNILEPKGFLRRRETSETRTCAAYAIARLPGPETRAILERAQLDKELSVRNAAIRALRQWES